MPSSTSTDWSFSHLFGSAGPGQSQFTDPSRVAVSPDGLTAWISDKVNNRIAVWTRPGPNSTSWSYSNQPGTGMFGAGDNQFGEVWGLAVSPDGERAWASDIHHNRITAWEMTTCPA